MPPRKGKSQKNQPEPTAIVHTRALLIKQADELQKLIAEQHLQLEQVKQGLLEAENAYNVVHAALARLSQKGVSTDVQPAAGKGKKKQAKAATRGKKRRNAKKMGAAEVEELRAFIRGFMKPGRKYAPKEFHAKVIALPRYKSLSYRQVWGIAERLVKTGDLAKVGKGEYKLNARRWKAKTKKIAKKASKGTKKGGSLPPWTAEVDHLLAMFSMLSLTHLEEQMNVKPKPHRYAVRSYLRRQIAKGKVKQPKRGYYASVD